MPKAAPHHTQRHTCSEIFAVLVTQLTPLLPQAFCNLFIFSMNFCGHKLRFTLHAMNLYVFWHMQSIPKSSPQCQTDEFHLLKQPCACMRFFNSCSFLIWKDNMYQYWLNIESLIFFNDIYFFNFTSSRKLAECNGILGKNTQLT